MADTQTRLLKEFLLRLKGLNQDMVEVKATLEELKLQKELQQDIEALEKRVEELEKTR